MFARLEIQFCTTKELLLKRYLRSRSLNGIIFVEQSNFRHANAALELHDASTQNRGADQQNAKTTDQADCRHHVVARALDGKLGHWVLHAFQSFVIRNESRLPVVARIFPKVRDVLNVDV